MTIKTSSDGAHKKIWWLTTAVLAVVALSVFLSWAEYRLILEEPISSWTTEPQGDCGIVLTGGPGRVREGVGLLGRGSIKKLILAGVHPGAHIRDIVPNFPLYGIQDLSSVILEKRSSTTYGNAQQTWPLIEALGCRSVVLITSSLHMRRAYRTILASWEQSIPIVKHSIPPGPNESRLMEGLWEVVKSFFYQAWAY